MATALAENIIEEKEETRKLSDIFDDALTVYENLDKRTDQCNSTEYQVEIRKCMDLLKESTRLVSSGGLFSSNELVDDIPTEHLRYLMLPYYLGELTLKQTAGKERFNHVYVATVYYKDFLQRCEDYELYENSTNPTKKLAKRLPQNELEDLKQMANERATKIEKYRQKKEAEDAMLVLKKLVERDHVDDETKRDYCIKLIKYSIMNAQEELVFLDKEIQCLEFAATDPDSRNSKILKNKDKNIPNFLKPVIITRDAIQKAVYGVGYPSLPTLTVQDFYDQRVRDGIFPDPEKSASNQQKSLQRMTEVNTREEEEKETADNEQLAENEDPEHIARQRAMDEFKDEVRRGDGNRYNRS